MGLDLSFNRKAAIDAGLQLSVSRNGTDEDVAAEQASTYVDESYINWLKESTECVAIPGTELFTDNEGVEDNIVIRANKWGRIYEPMTTWLKANNITWREY